MPGRHAPHIRARSPRPARRLSIRKGLSSIGAGLVAIALAASVAIPVTAASANLSTASAHDGRSQALSVSGRVSLATVTRDGSTMSKVLGKPGPSVANVDGWALPISASITSPYGPRAVICVDGGCTNPFHRGDDLAAACGTPFYAAAAGIVVSAGYAGTDGEMIVIQHADGISTAYAHMFPTGVLVAAGDHVLAGQNIGQAGSSGTSTGCHLYFEYRVGGVQQDPVAGLAGHGIALG
jgi:murein DD-endopeptidase MepM/ murein hydrolase activator NlpD